MERKKVRKWMKVVPHSKTADGRVLGLENSVVWRRAHNIKQNYLYVAKIPTDDDYPEYRLVLNFRIDNGGDYFLNDDFSRFNNKNNV